MRLTTIAFTACMFCLVILSGSDSFAQALNSPVPQDLLGKHFQAVHIEKQGFASLVAELSLSHDIPIGVEIADSDDDLSTYRIDFNGGTLSELLTLFFAQHAKYNWEIRDGVVNIFPKDRYRDPSLAKLLNVSIDSFSIKENTSSWDFRNALFEMSEVKKVLKEQGLVPEGFNFSGLYFPQLGRNFKLDASRMTLKSILNEVIRLSPIARCWRIKKYTSDGMFYLRVAARHEDTPATVQRERP